MRFIARFTIGSIFIATLNACSSISGSQLFTNYNQQIAPVRSALTRNDVANAPSLLPALSDNNVSFTLNQLEKGRVMQLNHQFEQSKDDFNTALTHIDAQNFAASIEISKGLETTASFLTNDNVREYFVPYYEQTMVHTLQALNFIALNDIEAALVEIRRANLVQEQALKVNVGSLEKAALNANIDLNPLQKIVNIYSYSIDIIRTIDPVFILSLQKYQSKVMQSFEENREHFKNGIIKSLLNEAQKKGLIIQDLDLDFFIEVNLENVDKRIWYNKLINQHSKEEILNHLIVYRLKGISVNLDLL